MGTLLQTVMFSWVSCFQLQCYYSSDLEWLRWHCGFSMWETQPVGCLMKCSGQLLVAQYKELFLDLIGFFEQMHCKKCHSTLSKVPKKSNQWRGWWCGAAQASKEIMTLRIGAIMVVKTVTTVIIFSSHEDGQSMLLVNYQSSYEFELKMPSC